MTLALTATPTKVVIETSAEGLDPGDVVTVEFEYDPDEVELILKPAPTPLNRWRAAVVRSSFGA